MKKYIVTIKTQFETINIVGLTEKVLYHVIEVYLKKEPELRLGGKTYSFQRIQEFSIHEFDNDVALDDFLKFVESNNLRIKSMTGREYFETKNIDKFSTDVTKNYLPHDVSDSQNRDKLKTQMKIFISHSSKNSDFGNALVELLIGVGVHGDNIIFTSNDAHGIPIGQNIFNWLKNRINEKPYVIYLLSPQYYSSVACLNEMGAAWVVENEHTMIFTPDFELSCYEFQNGALDPREIGFYINNQDRLTSFIENLKVYFTISTNPVKVNQKVRDFIDRISTIKPILTNLKTDQSRIDSTLLQLPKEESSKTSTINPIIDKSTGTKIKPDGTSRFLIDFMSGKLKDEEILLIHYIIETGKFRLSTGWQESNEIENIKAWEDVHGLNNQLSFNYASVLRRFEMRKLTVVSDTTSHGNTKEVALTEEFQEKLLDLSEEMENKILEVVTKNEQTELPF